MPLEALEKNPMIEDWFFAVALEDCFLSAGGGRAGVASGTSLPLAILTYGANGLPIWYGGGESKGRPNASQVLIRELLLN